jgi:hypothetical protein
MNSASVYNPNNFKARVSLAASYISAGRRTTRAFDTCFEMNDGAAVALALFCRAKDRPNGRLARRIWDYISRTTVEKEAAEHANIINMPPRKRMQALESLSARLRAR